GDRKPFVLGPQGKASVEGWAHVMDRQRCTALAIADFGAADEVRADADGRLRLRRGFEPGKGGERSLRFWLHFVAMPVQVGALTSPQAMLAPLAVEAR